MSVSMYRSAVERLTNDMATLDREIVREREAMLRAQSDANQALSRLSSTTSISTLSPRMQDLQRKNEIVMRHNKKLADLEGRRSNKMTELNRNLRFLEQAEQSAQRQRDQDDKRRRDDELRHTRDVSRELDRQVRLQRELSGHRLVIDLAKLPTRIKILFVAANPLDQTPLRLDEEVREITRMIRMSEYRDAIEFVPFFAARLRDLLQALNEHRPTIVHFSGHGDDEGNLVFQGDAGETKFVSMGAIAATMATFSSCVQLVVFNACFSRLQAELVVEHVAAAIGMTTAVTDEAARVFAAQFYSSVGFGHSLAVAFGQARAALMLEGVSEEDVPSLTLSASWQADELVFVRPD